MLSNLRWARSLAVLVVGLAVCGLVQAAPPEVKDDAGFFTPAAVSQANTNIQNIKRLYKKDLHLETFPEVPAELAEALAKDKKKTLTDWAASQAVKNKVSGIYVLICKDPPHLEVLVDNATIKKAFPAKDRDNLARSLAGRLPRQKIRSGPGRCGGADP